MKDYKRLTERSGKGICINQTSTNDNMSIWNAIERLADLEDMIDDGRLWFTPSNGLRPNPFECAKRWEELWYEVRVQYNDLNHKIENGTLVELPCKVGTIVYQIYKNCSKCSYFKEIGYEYDCWCSFDDDESKLIFTFDGDKDCVYIIEETEFTYNHIKDFGKSLFLTKAEAEAKLIELQS